MQLQTGTLVETNNGELYLVVEQTLMGIAGGFMSQDCYDETLSIKGNGSEDPYSIKRYSSVLSGYEINLRVMDKFLLDNNELWVRPPHIIWERHPIVKSEEYSRRVRVSNPLPDSKFFSGVVLTSAASKDRGKYFDALLKANYSFVKY